MPSKHLILCYSLLLPSVFPSIKVFSNESVLRIGWPKYWSFSNSPSNEYLGLISFRMDWLDLFEVQGTLKSLLQHHSSKASILQHSAFFIVQLSHPYMTTRISLINSSSFLILSLGFSMYSWFLTYDGSSLWWCERNMNSEKTILWTVNFCPFPGLLWWLSGKESEYSLEGLLLKLQYFGHMMWRADSLEKTLMLGKIEGRRRRGR